MATQTEEITSLFKEALDALSEQKYSEAITSLDKSIFSIIHLKQLKSH